MSSVFILFFFIIKPFHLILLIQYILFLAARDNLNNHVIIPLLSFSLHPLSHRTTYEAHLPSLIN